MPRLLPAVLLPLLSALVPALAAAGAPARLTPDCPFVERQVVATTADVTAVDDRWSAVRFRPDGRPMIAFSAGPANRQSLQLVDCRDEACSERLLRTVYGSGNYFRSNGFALTSDGRAVLLSSIAGALTLFVCSTPACTTIEQHPVGAERFSDLRDLLIDAEDRPLLIYANGTIGDSNRHDLYLRRCSDLRCSTSTLTRLLDVDPNGEWHLTYPSARLDAEGRLLLTFLQSNGSTDAARYRLLRCDDAACSSVTVRDLAAPAGRTFPAKTSLVVLADGRALALDAQGSFYSTGSLPTNLIACDNPGCSSTQLNPVLITGALDSIGLGLLNGKPLMASMGNDEVGFFACDDEACSSGKLYPADTPSPTLRGAALAVSPTGKPLMAYFDNRSETLQVLSCARPGIYRNSFEPPAAP